MKHDYFTDGGAFGCTAILCYSTGHWIGGTVALLVMLLIVTLENIEKS